MLNKTKDRFVNFSNFNYKVEDFSELNFETETFDLIISGLAIHHLDDSLKKNYFKKLKILKKMVGLLMQTKFWVKSNFRKKYTQKLGKIKS